MRQLALVTAATLFVGATRLAAALLFFLHQRLELDGIHHRFYQLHVSSCGLISCKSSLLVPKEALGCDLNFLCSWRSMPAVVDIITAALFIL